MNAAVRVRVPAKVNLCLAVGATDADGYHELATVFQALSLFDDLEASRAKPGEFRLTFRGEGAAFLPTDGQNLAVRAARALAHRFDVADAGVEMQIRKRIPVAGGMAGGSADAAAVLVACNHLWGCGATDAELAELGATLGADVPFALLGGTALGSGRGEVLEPIATQGSYHWALALSHTGLSTPAVFRQFDAMNPEARPTEVDRDLLDGLAAGDLEKVGASLRNDPRHGELELVQPLTGHGGDDEHPVPGLLQVWRDDLGEITAIRDIHLVQRHEPGPVLQSAVGRQFCLNHLEVGDRVASRFVGGQVHHVHDGQAAFDVAQEVEPQPTALGCALDQPGDVRDGVGHVTGHHDSQVGHQRGEGVVRDLGAGPGDGRDQGRLPGARKPDQTDVGHHLQLQLQQPALTLLPQQREAGGLARGGSQRRVAQTTLPARGSDELLALTDQVGQVFAGGGVGDDGADGDGQDDVIGPGTVLVVALAGRTVGGLPHGLAVVVHQGGLRFVGAEAHRPPVPAVAPVRTPEWFELLAAHRGDAVPTVACLDGELDAVDE